MHLALKPESNIFLRAVYESIGIVELICKCLGGEITQEEQGQLNEWLAESRENRSYMDKFEESLIYKRRCSEEETEEFFLQFWLKVNN
jgi:hypothetical protein